MSVDLNLEKFWKHFNYLTAWSKSQPHRFFAVEVPFSYISWKLNTQTCVSHDFLADISKLIFLILGWIIGLNKLKQSLTGVSNYGTRGTDQATHNFVLALSFSEQFVFTVNILIRRLPAILDKNWTKATLTAYIGNFSIVK